MSPEKKYVRDTITRLDNAYENFLEVLMERGGISRADAIKVYKVYQKVKVLKIDAYMGTTRVKHGGFLDKEVIHRALGKA